MNIKVLFCIPLLLLISNCKTQTSQTETTTAASENNTITLLLNQQTKIPGSKAASLQFKGIVEDSRCPVNVTCVWEGIAIVDIEGTSGNQKTNFQVGTKDFIPKSVTKSFSFSGYIFTLLELKPQTGGKEKSTTVRFKYEKEN